jgi:lipid II:glycine glycyltransferase (peptidoglycan interpeptide bridge formation enzyme)
MHRDHRQHIIHASKNTDIVVKKGAEAMDDCIKVFSVSSAKKSVELPTKEDIKKFLDYLPDNIQIYVSYYNSVPQSSIIYFLDNICYYALYAAMIAHPAEGINHLLHWQAMLDAKCSRIRYYDFVGSRIDPVQESKQDGLKRFKSHFGGEFLKGYLWKVPISKAKYYICCCLTKLISLIQFKYY